MRRVLRPLLLACFGVAVALAIVEAAMRLTHTPGDMFRYIGPAEPGEAARWVDHPFLPFVGKPGAEYEINVPVNGVPTMVNVRNNAYGFRGHELPGEKNPGDYFVVVLGESTTWGAAAATNARTWPELLEALLRERYPQRNVRVFNLGTQNATVAYNVSVLALTGIHTRPDLVIAYHGYNDFGPATATNYRSDQAHHYQNLALGHRWHGFQRTVPRSWLRSYAIGYLTYRADDVIDANRLSFYVQHPIDFDTRLDDAGVKAALVRNWQHLRTMAAIARGHGAAVLFSTFQFYDGLDRFHQLTNESLRELFEAEAIPYVDQDALIGDSDRSLQFDDCHFTRAGDEMMARNFFQKIVEEGLVEKR